MAQDSTSQNRLTLHSSVRAFGTNFLPASTSLFLTSKIITKAPKDRNQSLSMIETKRTKKKKAYQEKVAVVHPLTLADINSL